MLELRHSKLILIVGLVSDRDRDGRVEPAVILFFVSAKKQSRNLWQSTSRRTSVERSVVASAPILTSWRNFGFFPSLWMCRSIAQEKSSRALGCCLHVPVFRFCRMLSSTPQRFSHSLTLLFAFVHKRNNNRYASRCTTYILMPLSVLVCPEWEWGPMEDFNSYENFYVFEERSAIMFFVQKGSLCLIKQMKG